ERGRAEPSPAVQLALHHQHAHDRLRAGDEDALLRQIELVGEGDIEKRHRYGPFGVAAPKGGMPASSVPMLAAPVKRNPALGENGRDLLFKHGPSCYCARSQMSPTNKTTLWEGKPELGGQQAHRRACRSRASIENRGSETEPMNALAFIIRAIGALNR